MERNIAALLDTSAYTIKVMFKTDKQTAPKQYIYICNIPGVKVGDWVVVDGPDYDGYVRAYTDTSPMVSIESAVNAGSIVFTGIPKIVIVTAVDSEVAIEPNSETVYKWVVAKVDLTAYKETMQRNSQVATLVADAYKKSMRKSFAERILGDMETDAQLRLSNLLHKPEPVVTKSTAKRARKQS